MIAGADAIGQILLLPPEEAQAFAKEAEQDQSEGQWRYGHILDRHSAVLRSADHHPQCAWRKEYGCGRSGPVIIWGPDIGGSSGSSWGGGGGWGGGGFGGGGGGFGGGGASGGW